MQNVSRREFLRSAGIACACGLGAALAAPAVSALAAESAAKDASAAASAKAAASASAKGDKAASAKAASAAPLAERGLSGKVTVYMPSPAGLADKLAEGFKTLTGVEVEQFQGTTGEILARLEAEKANPVADVVILASWSDGLSMKKDDQIVAYTPQRADKAVAGWIDADSKLFGTSASAVGVIYNTTIFPTLDADWADLGGSDYTDQLAIPDPTKSGACKDFVAGYVTDNGWDAFEAMAKNGMRNPGANKAALEAVTTGEVGILVAGVDYNAYSSIKKGEPLAIYYPKGGTVVNPRPAMIMKTAPNLANAQAFVDYLYTPEAQKLVADAYLLPGVTDVDASADRTALKDVPQLKLDWDKMMEVSDEAAQKIVDLTKDNN